MKNTAIVLALAAALLAGGCVSTATFQKLEKRNALLQKRLKRMQKRVYGKKRASAKASDARPLPRPTVPAGLAAVHPATADQMVGLPENVGFVNRSPVCARQPNYWQIHNRTGQWLKLTLNGKPVVIVDDQELKQLGLVPPGMTVRLCVTLKYRGVYGPATTATVTAIRHTAPNPTPTPLPGLLRETANFRRSTIGMETWF